MRKKLVVRMLCLAMAASMIGTMVPTSLYPVVAHAETAFCMQSGRRMAASEIQR